MSLNTSLKGKNIYISNLLFKFLKVEHAEMYFDLLSKREYFVCC